MNFLAAIIYLAVGDEVIAFTILVKVQFMVQLNVKTTVASGLLGWAVVNM